MRKLTRIAAVIMIGAIALSAAACKKKTYMKITPDEFSRKLKADGYTVEEGTEPADHVIRNLAGAKCGVVVAYSMYDSVDIAQDYWDELKEESQTAYDAGALTTCKIKDHELHIADPSVYSITVYVDEMFIVIISADKSDAEDCKKVLGY